MNLLTQKHFDEVTTVLAANTGNEAADEILKKLNGIVEHLKHGHLAIINELLQIYDEASEHNLDVSRTIIYELAQRLAAVE
jgi:hypothetical protein